MMQVEKEAMEQRLCDLNEKIELLEAEIQSYQSGKAREGHDVRSGATAMRPGIETPK